MVASPIVRAIAKVLGSGRKAEPPLEEAEARSLFDADYYLATYIDVANSGIDPFKHFMAAGWREGRNPAATFSTAYYRSRYLGNTEINPLTHYVETGRASGFETHLPEEDGSRALFDPDYYCATYEDVARAGLDPFEHFMTIGWREGRNPAATFSTAYYRARHLGDAEINPLTHYIETGRASGFETQSPEHEIRSFIDPIYYRATYADVAKAGVDPFEHFMESGWREGRNPTAAFSTLYYRDCHLHGAEINPLAHFMDTGRAAALETRPPTPEAFIEVQRTLVRDLFDPVYYASQPGGSGTDPLFHYLTVGWHEGRSPNSFFDPARYSGQYAYVGFLGVSPFYHYLSQQRMHEQGDTPSERDPNTISRAAVQAVIAREFDTAYYLRQGADLKRLQIDALSHYVDHGWREKNRNPTPLFDNTYYVKWNADVAAAGTHPFYHYLTTGRAEGRRPNPVGQHVYPSLTAPSARDWAAAVPAADTSGAEYVVIMPVYRGFDETLASIHSVLVARQTTRFALHVINDATPDVALDAALADLAGTGLFSLEKNEANLGFVQTCNRGLRTFADKDVILLNADVSVFGDWLDRMVAHARHDPSIATITPFSNNATICSYPVTNDNNLIETECSARELDALAASCNAGRVSELPTGVGFCFLMSRAARDAIGVFDETAFGRGYGEENDFCLRAAKAGFRNVLAEDIFVYHAGQVSFAEFAATEYEPGQTALIAKHPDYPGRVGQHLRTDPGIYGRMRLDLKRLARWAGPNSIVFVSHALAGGIATHVRHMETRLRQQGVNIVHLKVGASDRWSIEIGSDAPDAPFCPNLRPTSFNQLRPLLVEFFGWLSPMAMHIHSLVGFDWTATSGLFDFARTSKLPYFFTLHDYSVVCHRNDLVLTNGRHCGLPEVSVCKVCVDGDRTYPEALDPAVRRQSYDAFLSGAAAVFAPSEDIRDRLYRAGASYPILVRPHEEDADPTSAQAQEPDPSEPTDPDESSAAIIDVVTVGGIGIHKGAQIIVDLARDANIRQLPIRFHIVGSSSIASDLEQVGVVESGPYERDSDAFAKIHAIRPACVFLPSIWPETFCYALSFAFKMKIPPVVFDLGAQSARVKAADFGFVIPLAMMDDVQGLNDLLCTLPYKGVVFRGPEARLLYRDMLTDYYGLVRPATAVAAPR